MKKNATQTLLGAFLVVNLLFLLCNISLAQEDPNDIGQVDIICDAPSPSGGRCHIHDYPMNPEDCIWDGRTIVYCTPW